MNDSLKAQCVAEFLGTGLFLFFGIGCLCALKVAGASLGLWEICIIWGLGISLAVYLTAGISGAHLNPAVTIALWLFASFPARKVLPFCVAQLAGAFGGAVFWHILYTANCLSILNLLTIWCVVVQKVYNSPVSSVLILQRRLMYGKLRWSKWS